MREKHGVPARVLKSHIVKAANAKGKLQILGYFTMQSLYNYSLKSSSGDYKLKNLILTCLPSFSVVL